MIYRLLAFALVLLFVGSCAERQEVKSEEPVAVQPPVEELKLPEIKPRADVGEEKKAEKPAVEKKTEEQYIMLNFENADLDTVISTIGEMLKINYILAPGVSGKITIQSHNKIPLSELFSTFQTVLEFNGFTAVKDGSFYRIVPIDTAKQQPVSIETGKKPVVPKDSSFVTQEIPLEYVKANDIANIVRNLMPRGTDIIVYEPSNMLIVTALPAGILKLLKMLEAIDIPATERDSIRTFVYNVENGEAKKLAEMLKNIYAAKKGAAAAAPVRSVAPTTPTTQPPTTAPRTPTRPAATGATVTEGLPGDIEGEIVIEAYDDINALIVKTTPRGYIALLETIKKLDVQPKQVLIEVLIAEISLNDTMKFGIEWLLNTPPRNIVSGFTAGGFTFPTSTTATTGTTGTTGTTATTTGSSNVVTNLPSGAFANIIDPVNFQMLISAVAKTGNVNVLASPHILALDNKEAKIEIGDEVPVPTSITVPTAGAGSVVNTTSSVQFKSVGTILTVTPHINEKKQVTLKLTQEVSQIGDQVFIGDQKYSGFKTRKATTTAIVQDGHTLVIGGIITETTSTTRSGIPLLSKIPILGLLFGTTEDTNDRKELILMVTPHVVANHEEADELTKEFQSRIKGIKKKLKDIEKKRKEDKLDEEEEVISGQAEMKSE